jgi:hypothetical protein
VNQVIVHVEAVDADSGQAGLVSYVMRTPTSLFAVDYDTGDVRLVERLSRDDTFNLTIDARDHGTPVHRSTVNVIIIVNGTGANAYNAGMPVFDHFMYDVWVEENAVVGTVLTTLHATAINASVTYLLDEQTDTSHVHVGAQTGELTVAVPFDYETTPVYGVIAYARTDDSHEVVRTLITVHVIDVNDNAPVFGPLPSTLFISSAERADTAVVHVTVTDGDSDQSPFGQVHVELTSPNITTLEYFQLDDALVLRVKKTLLPVSECVHQLVSRNCVYGMYAGPAHTYPDGHGRWHTPVECTTSYRHNRDGRSRQVPGVRESQLPYCYQSRRAPTNHHRQHERNSEHWQDRVRPVVAAR